MLGCSWIVQCFGTSSKYIFPNGVFSFTVIYHLQAIREKSKAPKKKSGYSPTFTNLSQKKMHLQKKTTKIHKTKTSPLLPSSAEPPSELTSIKANKLACATRVSG